MLLTFKDPGCLHMGVRPCTSLSFTSILVIVAVVKVPIWKATFSRAIKIDHISRESGLDLPYLVAVLAQKSTKQVL